MNKCVICGKDSGKGQTCCSAHRKALQRRNAGVTKGVTNVTVDGCDKPSVTDLELCRYCGKPLPKLERSRRSPGACYECAIKQPARAYGEQWPSDRVEGTGLYGEPSPAMLAQG